MSENTQVDISEIIEKDVFTTGEAARICNVSQQTIIRCFDRGRLRGFRVPGSRFRRIPRGSLIEFMRNNKIPVDGMSAGLRLLVVSNSSDTRSLRIPDSLEVSIVANGVEAGWQARLFRPTHLLLLGNFSETVSESLSCLLKEENGQVVVYSTNQVEMANSWVNKFLSIAEAS